MAPSKEHTIFVYKNKGYRDFKILDKKIVINGSRIEIDVDVYEGKLLLHRPLQTPLSLPFYELL